MSDGSFATADEAFEFFAERRRAGEHIDPIEFAARFPQFEPELSDAIAGLVSIDRAARADGFDESRLERIGAFRIVREIGRGGMGVVHEAIEEPLQRRVALKVLPPELVSSSSARLRFRREAELASRLDHSGIATIYGAGVEGERPWIAMRFVDGITLARAIDRARSSGATCAQLADTGRTTTLAIASLVAKIARALHSAHEQGVVHRDIKPSNIIVMSDGAPVLLDFGLAIAEDSDGRSLTRTGEAPGTPAYLAPETVAGETARPDAQSDVYALGVTLYEALTLRRPFDAPTRAALYHAILAWTPRDAHASNRDVSRDLAVVTSTAMERDRGRRYRSALALAEDLEACVAGRPIAVRPVPIHGRLLRWAKREPKLAALAGTLAIAVIGLAMFGGNYWATRSVVLAAERVAREREREQALTAGYAALAERDATSEAKFLHVLELDPASLDALAGRVLVRIESGRTADALGMLEHAPATAGFDALRALCAGQRVTQDENALSSAETSALDLMLIGKALVVEAERGMLSRRAATEARALAMMNEAVVRAPIARLFMHVERSIAATEAGDERTSRSASSALLGMWPDSYDAVCSAGIALARFDPAAATPILERAARLNPSADAPLLELGNASLELGDLESAERWYWLVLARGEDAEIYDSLGASYMRRECLDDAVRCFARAVQLNSADEKAWLNLIGAEITNGDVASAVLAAQRAVDMDPMSARAQFALGEALRRREDWAGARSHFEHAMALDPNLADVYGVLAYVLVQLGERSAARDVVAVGFEHAPEHPDLLSMQQALESAK